MAEKLALDGGPPVRTTAFPPWPALGEEDIAAVAEALRSGPVAERVTARTKAIVAVHLNGHPADLDDVVRAIGKVVNGCENG